MLVLFVCTGNTCRSAMAAAYLRQLCRTSGLEDIETISAGTFAEAGAAASPQAVAVGRRHGIDLARHRATPLDKDMIARANLIIAMTGAHRNRIGAIEPKALSKTKLLLSYSEHDDQDIADPHGGDSRTYENCLAEMTPAIDNLFLELIKL